MKNAIFPGSFDPITNGHLKTAIKASKLFDTLYVVILTNTKKKYLFDQVERLKLAQESLRDYANIVVVNKSASLTVDVAHELEAQFIVRGLRNEADFGYEREVAAINKIQDKNLETVFLLAEPNDSFISSSMIKEVATFDGDISALVPKNVEFALKAKLGLK